MTQHPPLQTSTIIRLLRIVLSILGVILFSDGAYLVATKRIHLGTLLPLVVGAVLCTYSLYFNQIHSFLKLRPMLRRLWFLGWSLFIVWSLSLIGFFVYLKQDIDHERLETPVDAIIVLGSGVVQGQPSPTLAARLDRAAELFKTQDHPLIIVSGGLDYGETRTEAEIMAAYLQQKHHISADTIQLEDQSTSTELNLLNSQNILQQNAIALNAPIAVVTSDFHTLRAAAIAHKQGYQNVYSVSAMTPFATRYNAWLREYFAYLSGWLLSEY